MGKPSEISKPSRNKFAPDGTVLPFPGITVLHHLTDPKLLNVLHLHDFSKFMASQSQRYIRLPENSWHSTLLDVTVYHPSRDKAYENATYAEEKRAADMENFLKHFTAMQSDLSAYLPIRMKLDLSEARLPKPGRALSIPLVTYEDKDKNKIASLREKLSSAFDIVADPGYKFHITLYYPINPISDDDFAVLLKHWSEMMTNVSQTVPVFEVNTIELCSFEDMWKYTPVKVVYPAGHTKPIDWYRPSVDNSASIIYPLVVLAIFIFALRRVLR